MDIWDEIYNMEKKCMILKAIEIDPIADSEIPPGFALSKNNVAYMKMLNQFMQASKSFA